ncbi:MAG: hypothetical protein AAGA28_02350 [Pseudomonadota bacterium]
MRRYLIAETDERGEVACVWVSRDDTRETRPVIRSRAMLADLEEYEVTGASRAAVHAWLQSNL